MHGVQSPEPTESLDPRRDCEVIMRSLVGCEFPFDYQRSMIDLVFLKDLAAPRIAGLIYTNGYIQRFPQKRYDDTSIFMMEFVKHGFTSPRGSAMIERLNRIHAPFRIRQEDYLYVLVGLMFEPIEWNERFGWRRMTATEREANYWFWRGVGERMNLTIIPPTFETAKRFKRDYEARSLRQTRAGVALTRELFALIESWLPRPLRAAVRPVLSALLEPPFLAYFDLPDPNQRLRAAVHRVLRLRSRATRWMPRRSQPRFLIDRPVRSYPAGYHPDELGPPDPPGPSGRPEKRPRRPRRIRSAAAEAAAGDRRFCQHRSGPAERAETR